MAYAKAHLEYRKAAVEGATPVGLVVMLYDGALRQMDRAEAALTARDLPGQNEALQKAQKIVMELMGALDMRRGGEIAQSLMALYGYVLTELVGANTDDDPARIENARRPMLELRAGWAELDENARCSVASASGAPISQAA